ncbi:hypothetical protein PISL3812_07394 [Talaromyces islandicus]|uniref:F-box domain-containing protein n=1 Tax=Talaromyces islandicus TaxID=28573 RepID=A0A0U1M5P3_TALIS|nr:hypothetical protein PISL3812_07394 [Talaromyces islandicus]
MVLQMANTLPREKQMLLLALPAELLIIIFGSIPSFVDAAHLAQTCKSLNKIWKQHLAPIYNLIAPSAIPCHRDLRGLLAVQGHLALDAPVIATQDIARVVETSKNGAKLIDAYHEEMERTGYLHDPQVPLVLSPSEETRFLQAHYQLWALLLLDKDQLEQRIDTMPLEQSFLLSDFLCVFFHRQIDDPEFQKRCNEPGWPVNRLQKRLRAQRNRDFTRLHGVNYRPVEFTPWERNGRYAWWCDRQQELFKKMLTGTLFDKEDRGNRE